ncbi:MAG: hypothetical protein CVU06_10380 [Bacteroidetes bacterium HGW-Bacteroidetes-22]|nr:MAG: hypothetical protein CVU06_10380 [Bacteroidetes bacterium HGW-Bacteroidetes-22]
MKTIRKVSLAIIVVVVATGIIYKLTDVKQEKSESINLVNGSKPDVPVTVIQAHYSRIPYEIRYHGTFEPNYEISIIAEAQGKVEELFIEEGEFVPQGKIIARLENDILSYQLELADATYQKARQELNRYQNLSPGEAVSVQQLEEVKLSLINAKSAYQTLKKQHGNTFIKSPVSGTVSMKYIEKGTFLTSGAPVADIIDTQKMKFAAWFTANDLVKIHAGQKVKVVSDLFPDKQFEGVIKVIGIIPDESKRYRVQAEIVNTPEQLLISGIDGTLTLSISQKEQKIIIPNSCLIGGAVKPSVYVVENDTAKLRQVLTSDLVNGQTVVMHGLKEGEQVVLNGQINIDENTKVRIVNNNLQ